MVVSLVFWFAGKVCAVRRGLLGGPDNQWHPKWVAMFVTYITLCLRNSADMDAGACACAHRHMPTHPHTGGLQSRDIAKYGIEDTGLLFAVEPLSWYLHGKSTDELVHHVNAMCFAEH